VLSSSSCGLTVVVLASSGIFDLEYYIHKFICEDVCSVDVFEFFKCLRVCSCSIQDMSELMVFMSPDYDHYCFTPSPLFSAPGAPGKRSQPT